MSTETTSTFKLRWYVSVAVALLIFAVVGVYSGNMARNTTGYDDEQGRMRLQKLDAMHQQEHKTLETADWVDKTKGVIRIPIDEAVTQEVALLQNDTPRAGAALPGATPAAAQPIPNTQPANAATPPPPPAAQGGTNPQPTK